MPFKRRKTSRRVRRKSPKLHTYRCAENDATKDLWELHKQLLSSNGQDITVNIFPNKGCWCLTAIWAAYLTGVPLPTLQKIVPGVYVYLRELLKDGIEKYVVGIDEEKRTIFKHRDSENWYVIAKSMIENQLRAAVFYGPVPVNVTAPNDNTVSLLHSVLFASAGHWFPMFKHIRQISPYLKDYHYSNAPFDSNNANDFWVVETTSHVYIIRWLENNRCQHINNLYFDSNGSKCLTEEESLNEMVNCVKVHYFRPQTERTYAELMAEADGFVNWPT